MPPVTVETIPKVHPGEMAPVPKRAAVALRKPVAWARARVLPLTLVSERPQ